MFRNRLFFLLAIFISFQAFSQIQWIKREIEPNKSDYFRAVDYDKQDNLYASWIVANTSSQLIKYTKDGTKLWSRNTAAYVNLIHTMADGRILTAGAFSNMNSIVQVFNKEGESKNSLIFGNSTYNTRIVKMDHDEKGNIVVGVTTGGKIKTQDTSYVSYYDNGMIVVVNKNQDTLFSKAFYSSNYSTLLGLKYQNGKIGFAVHYRNNLKFGGRSFQDGFSMGMIVIGVFDVASNTVDWAKELGSGLATTPTPVNFTSDGSLVVGGSLSTKGYIGKYGTKGDKIWDYYTKGWVGANFADIEISCNGEVFATGSYKAGTIVNGTTELWTACYCANNTGDFFALKLDEAGKFLNVHYGGGDSGTDEGYDMALDQLGNAYIAGYYKSDALFDEWKTLSAPGGDQTESMLLKINMGPGAQIPNISLRTDEFSCDKKPIEVSFSNPAYSFYWPQTDTYGPKATLSPGIHPLIIESCSDRLSKNITVWSEVPQISLGNDTTICLGKGLSFYPNFAGTTSHYWNYPNNTSNGFNFYPKKDTSLILFYSNPCGTRSDQTQIKVRPTVQTQIENNLFLCPGVTNVTYRLPAGFVKFLYDTLAGKDKIVFIKPAQVSVDMTDTVGCITRVYVNVQKKEEQGRIDVYSAGNAFPASTKNMKLKVHEVDSINKKINLIAEIAFNSSNTVSWKSTTRKKVLAEIDYSDSIYGYSKYYSNTDILSKAKVINIACEIPNTYFYLNYYSLNKQFGNSSLIGSIEGASGYNLALIDDAGHVIKTYLIGTDNKYSFTALLPGKKYRLVIQDFFINNSESRYFSLDGNPKNFAIMNASLVPVFLTGLQSDSYVYKVFPNPTADYIITTAEWNKVEILELGGRLLLEIREVDNKISISHLKPGMYIIRFYNNSSIHTELIKKI